MHSACLPRIRPLSLARQIALVIALCLTCCPVIKSFCIGRDAAPIFISRLPSTTSEVRLYQYPAAKSAFDDKTLEDKIVRTSASAEAALGRISAMRIEHPRLSMPWSENQDWALREKVSQFTVQIQMEDGDNVRVFILWRNLISDSTPELGGYPTQFLVERLQDLWTNGKLQKPMNMDLQILPFLDAFEFETQGGLTGSAYGVQGVADGTRIQTNAVSDVQLTMLAGFVRTADGSVIYELGQPSASEGSSGRVQFSQGWKAEVKELVAAIFPTWREDSASRNSTIDGVDAELIELGWLTALAAGASVAMESLSHHLTINLFWV